MIARELIKRFEGCSLKAYKDVRGIWTIGFGSTGPDVKDGVEWTEEECNRRINIDLLMIEKDIQELVKVPLTYNQTVALQSFIYNIGYGNFKSSTLLKKLNDKDYDGAADEFLKWCKAGSRKIKGLLDRRTIERKLFLTDDEKEFV